MLTARVARGSWQLQLGPRMCFCMALCHMALHLTALCTAAGTNEHQHELHMTLAGAAFTSTREGEALGAWVHAVVQQPGMQQASACNHVQHSSCWCAQLLLRAIIDNCLMPAAGVRMGEHDATSTLRGVCEASVERWGLSSIAASCGFMYVCGGRVVLVSFLSVRTLDQHQALQPCNTQWL